jgi:hypothetical protein
MGSACYATVSIIPLKREVAMRVELASVLDSVINFKRVIPGVL